MKTGYEYSFVPEPSGRAFTQLDRLVNDALRTQFGKSREELEAENVALDRLRATESIRAGVPLTVEDAASLRAALAPPSLPLSRGELGNRLRVKLANKLDEMMMAAIGFEQRFGESRIKDGSVIAAELLSIAKEEAKTVLAGWLSQGSLKKVVDRLTSEGPSKEDLRMFEGRVAQEVDALLRKRAADLAEAMVKNIREDVLNVALNKALFERYPELANLEALDRLSGDE